jgi:hypothetical protein
MMDTLILAPSSTDLSANYAPNEKAARQQGRPFLFKGE